MGEVTQHQPHSREAVRQLREILALAETGAISGAVVVYEVDHGETFSLTSTCFGLFSDPRSVAGYLSFEAMQMNAISIAVEDLADD